MRILPVYTWNRNLINLDSRRRKFIKQPWAQGVILISFVIIAMLLANLPWTKDAYHHILETSLSMQVTTPGGQGFSFPKEMTVEKFINDILMVVFFFIVGLEIKREIKIGELSSPKKAIMPVSQPSAE